VVTEIGLVSSLAELPSKLRTSRPRNWCLPHLGGVGDV